MKCLRCVTIFHCEQNVGKVDRIMDCESEEYLWSRSMAEYLTGREKNIRLEDTEEYWKEAYWTGGPKILDMRTQTKY